MDVHHCAHVNVPLTDDCVSQSVHYILTPSIYDTARQTYPPKLSDLIPDQITYVVVCMMVNYL